MPQVSPRRSIERTVLRKGAKYDVELLSTKSAAGDTYTREVIRHAGSVIVLPVLELPDGSRRVVLIENFRLTLERPLLELPAGTRGAGENPAVCAARELQEETGFAAMKITPLASFFTAPGLTDERMDAFLATGLTHVGQHLEPDEDIRVLDLSPDDALARVTRNDLDDAKSMLVLLLARAKGLI